MLTAPLIAFNRLRMGTDGNGITTLVFFHGCPLRCKYCLNPWSISEDAKIYCKSSDELLNILKKDELYYIATGGGVTFGGGEPLLRADYIKEVLDNGAKKWHTTVETSLNVPIEQLEILLPYIDEYIVDVKDMNSEIYEAYTSQNNERVKSNLKWLVEHGKAGNIICRIPLIPEFNNIEDMNKSKQELEKLGIIHFDTFKYVTNKDYLYDRQRKM